MIFGPRLEPNHDLEEYIAFPGDDADFVRTCFNREDEEPCTRCGQCEDCYYGDEDE